MRSITSASTTTTATSAITATAATPASGVATAIVIIVARAIARFGDAHRLAHYLLAVEFVKGTFHITALGKADLALALAGAEVSVGIGDLAKFATVILELCPAAARAQIVQCQCPLGAMGSATAAAAAVTTTTTTKASSSSTTRASMTAIIPVRVAATTTLA